MTTPALSTGPFQRIDAVVFDLDDTLFDTTGQLMEPAHREAAQAMIDAGLEAPLEALVTMRLELGRARVGEDTNVLVAQAWGHAADSPVVEAGRSTYFKRRIESLDPFPGTLPLLSTLQDRCRLLLMTTGDPGTQRTKVHLLGIAQYFVDMVFVPLDQGNKHAAMRSLLRFHALDAGRVVVIGDRLDREIEAGRRLGTWTVRMARGEGGNAQPRGPLQQPHYSIDHIEAVALVLEDIDTGEDTP